MRIRIASIAPALAGLLAAGAVAAPQALDPLALTLRAGDLGGGATGSAEPSVASDLRPFGVPGLKGAHFKYLAPAGGSVTVAGVGTVPRQWSVEGDVFVAPAEGAARKLFQLGKRAQTGFFVDLAGTPRAVAPPARGSEQFAFVTREYGGVVHGAVFVRAGPVVWQLAVAPLPLPWRPSQAQVLAELKRDAAKLKRRVDAAS